MNFYNEIDDGAAAILRELIRRGLIAPGVVDQRSIEDITPNELKQYTQCHFFAGIGVWSLALRRAGWPDDKPVWTGSCPCQPFSAAGKGDGFDDERHLWPAWHHLISQRKPEHVLGEQVASKDGLSWLDLVHSDLESEGYAVAAVDLCAAGVGAPHIRQRLYFVADTYDTGLEGSYGGTVGHERSAAQRGGGADGLADAHMQRERPTRPHCSGARNTAWGGEDGILADAHGVRLEPLSGAGLCADAQHDAEPLGDPGRLADAEQHDRGREAEPADHVGAQADRPADQHSGHRGASAAWPGPTNGHWRVADWLYCRDAKWRPVEPGTFPLAHGAPARVGRLRGYGNAIVAQQAEAFIRSYLEARGIEFDVDL